VGYCTKTGRQTREKEIFLGMGRNGMEWDFGNFWRREWWKYVYYGWMDGWGDG